MLSLYTIPVVSSQNPHLFYIHLGASDREGWGEHKILARVNGESPRHEHNFALSLSHPPSLPVFLAQYLSLFPFL